MRKYLFFVGCSFAAIAAPALAEESGPNIYVDNGVLRDNVITVLASGMSAPVNSSGQSISVMGADELDDLQTPDITTALERLPGVTFTRNGGLGSFTGVRVRGAGAEQLLVLIDGIRVADVASPGGGYDFGTLSSGGIGKIELLRGSNSVVWGSEAIGGVMAITSRRIDGIEASAEYGADDSVNGQLGAGLVEDAYEFTVNGGYSRSDGFSSAASGTEKDGYRQYRVNGTGAVHIMPNLSAVFAGRYADSRFDFDGYSNSPPYGLIDTPEYSDVTEWSGRAGLEYSLDKFQIGAGYAIYDNDRANYNPDYGDEATFASKGRQERVELNGRYGDAEGLRIDFGADHEWERYSTTYDTGNSAESTSAHALVGWGTGGVNLAAGVRIDDYSDFGSEWTFGANGSYQFADDWRVRASYGEGFKAPTLYQRYSDYGDVTLQPERSKSYDFGIEKGDRNAALHIAATVFRRDSRNLIDFASCVGAQCETRPFGLYQNVGKARAQGVEVELGAQVSESLRAQAAYSYVDTEDRTPDSFNQGNELARRPSHAVTVSVDWTSPLAGLELGGDLRMVSDSYDDAGNFTRLNGYALGSVRARLPVTERIELFGRIENVTDEQYQTVAGYNTQGRSAFIGARARF